MNLTKEISEMILIQVAATGSIKAGFDKVIGDGAFEQMAGDLYDEIKSANE